MNAKTVLVLAALSAAASIAFGQERVPDSSMPETPFVSMKTRAEVRAELEQARRDGSLQALQSDHYMPPALHSPKTREQVRAELDTARRTGELARLNSSHDRS